MTAAECEVPVPEPPQEQAEEECPAAEPKEISVDSVITVDTVVEQDGKVEETCHEEVNIKQTFTPEEPMPYGPDESLTQEGKVQFLALNPNCVRAIHYFLSEILLLHCVSHEWQRRYDSS